MFDQLIVNDSKKLFSTRQCGSSINTDDLTFVPNLIMSSTTVKKKVSFFFDFENFLDMKIEKRQKFDLHRPSTFSKYRLDQLPFEKKNEFLQEPRTLIAKFSRESQIWSSLIWMNFIDFCSSVMMNDKRECRF